MKTWKLALVLSTLALLAGLLVACSAVSQAFPPPPGLVDSAKTAICSGPGVFWTCVDFKVVEWQNRGSRPSGATDYCLSYVVKTDYQGVVKSLNQTVIASGTEDAGYQIIDVRQDTYCKNMP